MTNEETINRLNNMKEYYNDRTEPYYVGFDYLDNEALDMAIKALKQQSITWIVGKDNCRVAVRNMSIDKMQKICAIIGEEEQQPSEDCISREQAIKQCGFGMTSLLIADCLRRLPSVTPKTSWIPVSERLPEDLEPVNITWVNHDPESYYTDIKDKPYTATGVYFNGQWYWWSTLCTDMLAEYSHNYDDIIDDDIEITAWMPLPSSYQGEENG